MIGAQDGSVHIWLDPGVLAKLKTLRGPGVSYSDVILRGGGGVSGHGSVGFIWN